MKKYFVLLLIFVLGYTQAQKHEVGLFLGGANGITDVGRSDYINPFPRKATNGTMLPIAIGFIYRYNLNPQQSLRFNLDYATFGDNDINSTEDYRYYRGASYNNKVIEASILFEYNFFPINSEQKFAHSPYIFAGIGAFGYNKNTYTVTNSFVRDTDGNIDTTATTFDTSVESDSKKEFAFTVPFGVGYKVKFNWNWIIGAEVGFRPTGSDGLDMGAAKEKDFTFVNEDGLTGSFSEEEIENSNNSVIGSYNIGNRTNRDWYVFSGLTLTYTFGRPSCYCD